MATVLEFLSYNIIQKDMYDSLIESQWLILSCQNFDKHIKPHKYS